MNGRNAKMLRRLRKDNKVGKRMFKSYTKSERALIRADYTERGEDIRIQYTNAKRIAKQELISE